MCHAKFFSTNIDRFIMRAAIRDNILLTPTSPLADEMEGEGAPRGFKALTPEITDEDIDDQVRPFVTTVAHPMRTCTLEMVLDGEFRVKDRAGECVTQLSSQSRWGHAELQCLRTWADVC